MIQALRDPSPLEDSVPEEWVNLRNSVRGLPEDLRSAIEPVLTEALEQAEFRGRVLSVAREALGRQRLDLEMLRFDLDATRREREALRRRVEGGRGKADGQ